MKTKKVHRHRPSRLASTPAPCEFASAPPNGMATAIATLGAVLAFVWFTLAFQPDIALAAPIDKSASLLDEKQFASQFEFVQPANVGSTFIPAKSQNLLNWNAECKQKVLKCARQAETKAPGLLTNAIHGSKLRLFRATVLNEGDTINGGFIANPDPMKETTAATTPGAMTFSEKFFAHFESGRAAMFSHEITHAADIGNEVAYSPEWVSFMSRNKIKTERSDSPYVEALAETVSDWFVGLKIPDQENFENQILAMLCKQSPEKTNYSRNMTAGYTHFRSKKYLEADANFKSAAQIFPESAEPHILRTSALYLAKQNKEALAEAMLACQKLDAAKVSFAEPRLQQLLYLRALLNADVKGDYKEAIRIADKLLILNANHRKANMLKAYCQQRLKK